MGRYKYSPSNPTPLRGIRSSATRWTGSGPRSGGHIATCIFVGNLPSSASIDAMFETFEPCGGVQTVEMIGRKVGASKLIFPLSPLLLPGDLGTKDVLTTACLPSYWYF